MFTILFQLLFSINLGLAFTPYIYDCSGQIDNDEMYEYCQQWGSDIQESLWKIGTRFVYHSFETIAQELSKHPEIEASYDMIFIANSAEWQQGSNADPIPPQHMVVLEKSSQQRTFFRRNSNGMITGLAPGVRQLSDIVGSEHRDRINGNGLPRNHQGMEIIPVSTGVQGKLRSFSGIFQINWERSRQRPRRSWREPMSNPLYLGYYYTYPNGRRERISYAAIHGTPSENWDLLGVRRDSAGCVRVHPAIMEDVRAHVENMDSVPVFNLHWDYELPVQNTQAPWANHKPALIIIFDGYESQNI
jgi:lipoprotein-anchoring transpeptidase ErfK/SrfK